MRAVTVILACLPLVAVAQRAIPRIQQPSPLPQYVPSVPEKDAASRIADQKLQAAYQEYRNCVADHPKQTELYLATARVIQARNDRARIEYELATSPALRARWPEGYDQIVASSLEDYRKAGGSAESVAAVVPMDDPCPAPSGRATAGKP
jgi:hypothetical protein